MRIHHSFLVPLFVVSATVVGVGGAEAACPATAQMCNAGAAALGRVLVKDDLVEGLPEDRGLVPDVAVAPVAGCCHSSLAREAAGVRLVEEFLSRLEYGVYA